MVEKITIETYLKLSKEFPTLDVRSPSEYFTAHIPGAYSFPLFTDDERKAIGTAYKQKSRKDAIKIGLDVFGPNMRKMVENAEIIATANPKTVLVHCWRGGMRSAAVAWLLDLYGFKVYTLIGGYKGFRNWALAQFEKNYTFKILGGYTGSGKTIIIQNFEKKKIPVIDLEKIANHKGSAFGAIGEATQPRQEMFENSLAVELFFKSQLNAPIWLEDESQRVGAMIIPKNIWEQMRNSAVYFLDIPFSERLKYLVSTYGKYKKDELVAATMRIQKRLGGLETKNAINFLLEDKFEESFSILLQYYDKLYTKGLQNRSNLDQLLNKIPCETVTSENQIKCLNE